MAQFKRTDIYALMGAVMKELQGVDDYDVIDAQGFADAGKLAMEYKTDEIFNALTIVGARLMIETRPYKARLHLLDSTETGYFNPTERRISFYSKYPLPSGAFNTNINTNFALGFDNGENPSGGTPSGTKDQWEQNPRYPLEMSFFNSEVYQDCITNYLDQLKIIFTSEEGFARYWSGLLEEHANDMEQQKEGYNTLVLLSRMAIAAAMGAGTSSIKGCCTVVDLTTEFNSEYGTNYSGEDLRTTYRKEFYEFFVSKFKILSDQMTHRSGLFHYAPVLTLGDGDHYILRHSPKANQRFLMYNPLYEKAKATIMPEIFNDKYLSLDNFEAVDFWQYDSVSDSDKATAKIDVTIPGWLESAITGGVTTVDTKYSFAPDYIVGCLFDDRSVSTQFQFESARTTPVEARKNFVNTWIDIGKGNINDVSHNFILFVMSANEPTPDNNSKRTKK